MPFSADLVAAWHRPGSVLIGRSPRNDRPWIRKYRPCGFQRDERRDQGRTVGDKEIPGNRGVMTSNFFDRMQIDPGIDLITGSTT